MADDARSPWAKAPERGLSRLESPKLTFEAAGSDDEDKPDPTAGLFSPKMMSSPSLRNKVRSSGYGRETVTPSDQVERTFRTREEKEIEQATFKPNLKYGASLRAQTKSAGYGKELPQPKQKVPPPPRASFKPKTTFGAAQARLKKQAPSNNYGKEAASKPKAKAPPKPSFAPNMGTSAKSRKLRAQAPSKTYLAAPAERPATPKRVVRNEPLRYTLAADPGREKVAESPEPLGPPMDLSMSEENLKGTPLAGVFPFPEPLKQSKLAESLKEQASSSGYTGSYEPHQNPLPEREESPRKLCMGTAETTYLDSPDKLPVVTPMMSLFKSVTSSGYGTEGYEPVRGEITEVESAPTWGGMKGEIPGIEELALPPATKVSRQVQSTGYGKDWVPEQGEKYTPKYFAAEEPSEEEQEEEEEDTITTTMGLDEDTTVLPIDNVVDEY